MSKKTPFYERHIALGARMTDFAGFLMPLSYSGIRQEHLCVRNSVGAFDVSHMGEFMLEGKGAEAFLQKIISNDVSKIKDGQAQYSLMCYPDGGIVDDLIVYRFLPEKYMLVVNASNTVKDFEWLKQYCPQDVFLHDVSDSIALLAIQGPRSSELLQALSSFQLKDIPFYHFIESDFAGKKMFISRTGYTGEPGFELYHSPSDSEGLWDALFQDAAAFGLQAVGLGARDTLRMEMKYLLYGNDIDHSTNPIEAGLGWICKMDKGDFIGREAILKVQEDKPSRRLVAFVMEERGIARHGYEIFCGDTPIGRVSSGSISPSLDIGIGMAYIRSDCAKIGQEILIDIRGKRMRGRIVKPPFIDRSPMRDLG